jgi:hypothetical protein
MQQFLKNLFIPNYKNSFHPFLLRKPFLLLYTACLLTVNFFTPSLGGTAFAGSIKSSVLVEMANNERKAAGLHELKINSKLVSAAYAKAENIFEQQYWSHYGPNGETPWQFIIASGYDYVYAGENLAKGFNSSQGVHSAWMASKTHRENIMNSNYKEIGIAVVPGELQGEYVILVVQMFGTVSSDESDLVQAGDHSSSSNLIKQKGEVQITYPQDGDILANNDAHIKGESSDHIKFLKLYDNQEEIADLICTNGVWDYRPSNSWEDGEHLVRVEKSDQSVSSGNMNGNIKDVPTNDRNNVDGKFEEKTKNEQEVNSTNTGIYDEVAFVVDTEAPKIIENSFLSNENTEKTYPSRDISVKVEGEVEEVVLMVGNLSKDMQSTGDGNYTVNIPKSAIDDIEEMKIFVVDKAGNNSVKEFSSEILGKSIKKQEGIKLLGNIFKEGGVTIINRIIILFIAVLLIIDSVYLLKLNILHTKGKMLFPMAIWILLVGIGLVVGSGGSIR